jgi:dTDP-4-amino-4,6-dideoxygalactose transaminase
MTMMGSDIASPRTRGPNRWSRADHRPDVRASEATSDDPAHAGSFARGRNASTGRPHGIHILEDCAQSHGGHIDGKPFGTFASWSFCQDKIMTTGGEGGMLCTPYAELFARCWSYSQHGKDHATALGLVTKGPSAPVQGDPSDSSGASLAPPVPGSFKWVVHHEGTNLRMTEMQAAICLRQLAKLPAWSAARRRNGLTPAACGRGQLDGAGRLPVARQLGETSLTFLCHHTIDEASMRAYAAAARECLLGIASVQTTG